MGGMKHLLIFAIGSSGLSDSRFGHGPSPYNRDPVNFWWVVFIGFMLIAICWYILSIMNKHRRK
jgi:hypothetical protein